LKSGDELIRSQEESVWKAVTIQILRSGVRFKIYKYRESIERNSLSLYIGTRDRTI